jgi:hypothetical protein
MTYCIIGYRIRSTFSTEICLRDARLCMVLMADGGAKFKLTFEHIMICGTAL